MCEKEKQELVKEINNLSPMDLTKLCLKVIKRIVGKESIQTKEEYKEKPDGKHFLAELMLQNNIKIDEDK